MEDTIYIHYGSDHFDKRKFCKVRNVQYDGLAEKPKAGTGLWASPEYSKTTWKEWCKEEDFYIENLLSSFSFKLLPTAKVLYIRDKHELWEAKEKYFNMKELVNVYNGRNMLDVAGTVHFWPDFEKIAEDYDAMYVEMWWGNPNESSYWQLYGWDVDSLLVFNPNVVEEVHNDSNS